jgi:acyl-CoA synthetase (NDP forming)
MSDLDRLIDPDTIAIAGLSSDPGKHGARVLAHLRRIGFQGRVWGVNPKLPVIDGVDIHATVADLPDRPDVVVAAVPAAAVADVVRQSAGTGVVICFASGFAERGEPGSQLQEELVAAATSVGTRLLGPNSGGVIRPDIGLAASFLTCLDRPVEQIRSGPIAVVSQSGGMGSYLHNLAAARGEGIAISVSTGNEADIKLGETIEAVSRIDQVEVVLAVMETVRDGEAFIAAVRSAQVRGKRLVVCRVGAGGKGSDLITSHTGALAIPKVILDGVLASLGVTVAETPAEAYEVAALMAQSRIANGARAGVVTHSGGIAILLADLAERVGLRLEDPTPSLVSVVGSGLDHGAANNPLDMGGIIGGPHRFAEIVGQFAGSGEYDAVLAVSTAHPPAHTDQRVGALLDLDTEIPLIHLWMAGDQGAAGLESLRRAGAPVTEDPRAAIGALAGLTRVVTEVDVPEPLPGPPETWGLPLDHGLSAGTPDEARAAAESLSYPVALKLEAAGLDHKTEVGGVVLDVRNSVELETACGRMFELAATQAWSEASVRVQRYRPGLEMIVGGLRHQSFGPLISIGMGGVLTEVIRDVVFAPAPVGVQGAREMIDGLRGRRALDGWRGAPPADIGELARLVSQASRGVAGSHLTQFEINPLIWDGDTWIGVDWLSR